MKYYEFMKLYEKHKYAYTALAILTADPMLGTATVIYWGTDFQENQDEAKILAEMAAKGESTTAMLFNATRPADTEPRLLAPTRLFIRHHGRDFRFTHQFGLHEGSALHLPERRALLQHINFQAEKVARNHRLP